MGIVKVRTRNLITAIAVGGIFVVASPRAALADAAKGAKVYKTHQCAMIDYLETLKGGK